MHVVNVHVHPSLFVCLPKICGKGNKNHLGCPKPKNLYISSHCLHNKGNLRDAVATTDLKVVADSDFDKEMGNINNYMLYSGC